MPGGDNFNFAHLETGVLAAITCSSNLLKLYRETAFVAWLLVVYHIYLGIRTRRTGSGTVATTVTMTTVSCILPPPASGPSR